MKAFTLFLFLACFAFSQTFEDLRKRLEDIKTLRVVFVQTVQYSWASKPEVSKGIFYAQKGGRFRIEYEQPEKMLIVSDGFQVMVYSQKDRTAIIDRVDRNTSPVVEALFLISKPISEVFDFIGEMETSKGKVFILKPKVKDNYFSRVFLEVSHRGEMKSIKVEEKEGITTIIDFISMFSNFTPSENLFQVKAPEGSKIIKP
ncbi:MAG: outer membrane lipoprotein carrier protein LolA [Aquificaceae bacterium]|nr:outer membrane lipoprotein carrier protein LolA [Aquificaceae bacterium]MCX8163909.1 outer membrane lipoprotein carrier protein LolA [Aquificaceae bacterium]